MAVADALVELIERDACFGVGVELGIPAQSLGDTVVLVVEDRRERPEEMSCKNSAVGVREIERELFDFSDGGHVGSVAECRFGARAAKAPNDPKLSDCGGWRAGCMVGGKAAAEAASVTAGAVRCSAWLGVAAVGKDRGILAEESGDLTSDALKLSCLGKDGNGKPPIVLAVVVT